MHRNTIRVTALLAGISGAVILGGWLGGGTGGLQLGLVAAIAVNGLLYFFGDTMALRAMHARPISEIERPELYRIVRELATAARQPMPRIYLSPTAAPNAFATGRSPRRAAICCTTGLLRMLNERELRGVVAHELAHIRERDTLVCSVAATLATFITSLTALALLLPLGDSEDEDVPSLLGGLLFLVLGPVAALMIHLAVSRSREYRADLAAARLTGDPLGLAGALRKVEIGGRTHPLPAERGLLAAGHLMIAHPFPNRGMSRLFSVHPPTTERIRRLRAMADGLDLG
ncbi:M48 family metalloprotease [Marinitenerispora sediminis]|uniref:Protease HtpX homolog n=1 Tax=Marinitenerispora sediminis TaxID=1931232 RepID=A0A368T0K6_9ACTN|nr:M48 family metalloprotease [Marinitenerispora sediminis]RCV52772.1 protease HtpX [Marinitenerispora sediminis]RCV55591.1 protease HtpX [Marinitenerispora sediminis]RCV61919.1 protease HtpX [Marinitenerispora sediminis]